MNKKTQAKGKMLSLRAASAQCVFSMLYEGKSLSALLPEYQQRISAKDSALLQELTFGVARVLPRLSQILNQLLDKPLKGKTRIVHCLLLVGLYQILYTRIPAHAAVDEVVNASCELKVNQFRGLINAVLRRFLREEDKILARVDKNWHSLHPDWFINLLKPVYPNWQEIINANNQKPPMWLRINPNFHSVADYQKCLAEQGITAQACEHPQALRLEQAQNVQKLPFFNEGHLSVQDVHAQWAGILLAPENHDIILDACAAPGGKTTHLLELAPKARVIALDVEEKRLKRVTENLARMQQKAQILCADASEPEHWLGEIFTPQQSAKFDKILLDAPCSATGVIRRHPDIKWLRKAEDIEQLVALQSKILHALWGTLKEGGILLYATCSVLKQENASQIEAFLATHSDAELIPLPFAEKDEIGHQFLPQAESGDGFYYAKLKKRKAQ